MTGKQQKVSLSGNEAIATAMRQINPDVVAAYPITPSTEVPQYFSAFVANGQVDTDFVTVESEHSAMSATIGASAAGVRAMTATSANGLAYMWEVVYIAASMRLPIVMPVVNRALSGPLNIHCDHSDSMGAKDAGWIQLFSEDNQEVYDNIIQALRIAEHPDVSLPVMVMQDGFVTSHGLADMTILSDEDVKAFVGEKDYTGGLLDVDNPVSMGLMDLQPYYIKHKRQQVQAMENAKKVILDIAKEYEELTGRKYSYFEEYKMEDAEAAILVLNSTAGTAKYVVDLLREQGKKVGLIKLRLFRPFPGQELAQAIKKVKALAVMDRIDTFSTWGGPVFTEVRNACYGQVKDTEIVNYIYGLGGKDTDANDILSVYQDLMKIVETGKVDCYYQYLGIEE